MGGTAAQDSIDRVMKAHHDDVFRETWDGLPDVVKALHPRLELEAGVHEIERWLVFDVAGREEYLQLADLLIWELAERFPDCELGW